MSLNQLLILGICLLMAVHALSFKPALAAPLSSAPPVLDRSALRYTHTRTHARAPLSSASPVLDRSVLRYTPIHEHAHTRARTRTHTPIHTTHP